MEVQQTDSINNTNNINSNNNTSSSEDSSRRKRKGVPKRLTVDDAQDRNWNVGSLGSHTNRDMMAVEPTILEQNQHQSMSNASSTFYDEKKSSKGERDLIIVDKLDENEQQLVDNFTGEDRLRSELEMELWNAVTGEGESPPKKQKQGTLLSELIMFEEKRQREVDMETLNKLNKRSSTGLKTSKKIRRQSSGQDNIFLKIIHSGGILTNHESLSLDDRVALVSTFSSTGDKQHQLIKTVTPDTPIHIQVKQNEEGNLSSSFVHATKEIESKLPQQVMESILQLMSQGLVYLTAITEPTSMGTLFNMYLTSKSINTQHDTNLTMRSLTEGADHIRNMLSWCECLNQDIQPTPSQDNNNNHQTQENKPFDPEELYEALKSNFENFDQHDIMNQDQRLLPKLRRYQLAASTWMIHRESLDQPLQLHPLWSSFTTLDNKILYLNNFTSELSLKKPVQPILRGGILSDEMGLGKTLEVLQCILWQKKDSMEAATTAPEPPKRSRSRNAENILCVCGAKSDKEPPKNPQPSYAEVDEDYIEEDEVVWVQCDKCHTWQHGACVGWDSIADTAATFYCNQCLSFSLEAPVESNTTLIICPDSILQQWRTEIDKHIVKGALNVLVYPGVKTKLMTPKELTEYDIILASYDLLRNDINHIKTTEYEKSLRGVKKYKHVPTPLPHVSWHRIILDECQMVESTTAKASSMCNTLISNIKWCVSGTPFQRGLDDLYGLILFLGLEPYHVKHWFKKVLQEPFETSQNKNPLVKLVQSIMWRSSKTDPHVVAELDIPPQTEKVIYLNFTPVESYFYKKQQEQCMSDFNTTMEKMKKKKLDHLSHSEKTKLLQPLLRLRQACCHYSVGSNGVRNGQTLQKNVMSMEELLQSLVAKAVADCQEAFRAVLVSMNGLAALLQLPIPNTNGLDPDSQVSEQTQLEEAVKMYCEILDLIEKNSQIFEPDPLPTLHTLHHLTNLLHDLHQDHILVGTDDLKVETLLERREAVRAHYTKDNTTQLTVYKHSVQQLIDQLKEDLKDAKTGIKNSWWNHALHILSNDPDASTHFMVKVNETVHDLLEAFTNAHSNAVHLKSRILSKVTSPMGLRMVISRELEQLYQHRESALTALQSLQDNPTTQDISLFISCKNCRPSQKGPLCNHCQAENIILEYEKLLYFAHQRKNDKRIFSVDVNEEVSESRDDIRIDETTRANSELEVILKALHQFIVPKLDSEEDKDVKSHAKQMFVIFEKMKSELKQAKHYLLAKRRAVAEADEINQALQKIALRQPQDVVDDLERKYKILPEEVEGNKLKLLTERGAADLKLATAKNQLSYLNSLAKNSKDSKSLKDETCPVCYDSIGPQCVILACGHAFCESCMSAMLKQGNPKRETFKCPTCRARMNMSEVSYILDTQTDNSVKEQLIDIQGSYSTKISAIVRHLLTLQKEDPYCKALVFSEWNDVLVILESALKNNQLPCIRLHGKHKFQSKLDQFKNNKLIRALLLPIKSGSNGLNLIEATHVIMIEPLLHPGSELQAFNRVHRIGQSKETTVHRFIVNNTVEQKVFNMARKKQFGPDSTAAKLQLHANKKDAEEISVDEITQLFNEAASATELPVSPEKNNNNNNNTYHSALMDSLQTEEEANNRKFWSTVVKYNKSVIPRTAASLILERMFSWECKEKNEAIHGQPTVILHGRRVYEFVAKKLQELPPHEEHDSQTWVE